MGLNSPSVNLPGSGGASLGTATGALRINTSDLKNAVDMVRQSVQAVNEQAAKVGQGAATAMQQVRTEVEKIKGPLAALTAVGAGFVALGLHSADNLKIARIQLTGVLGGLDSANKLIAQLQDKSRTLGVAFNDVLGATRSLLPQLQGNTEELDRYLDLTIRLATLKPEQGIKGAAYAINEALSSGGSYLVSLSSRFELSRTRLRELTEQTGDFGKALDILLTEMGYSNETVAAMADTMTVSLRQAKSLIVQIAGTAFQPLLENAVIPLLQKFSDFLLKVSEMNPKVLGLAGSVIALATAGGTALLTFAKLAKILETIKTLSIAGSLGKLGLAGGIVVGGTLLGVEGLKAAGRATGNEQLQQTSLKGAFEILKQATILFASILQPLGRTLGELGAIALLVGAHMKQGFGWWVEAIAKFVTMIGETLHVQALQDAGEGIQEWAEGLKMTNKEREELALKMQNTRAQLEEFGKGLGEAIAQALYSSEQGTTGATDEALVRAGIERFTEDQVTAWGEFQDDLKGIEEQAQTDRLKATEDFERDRQGVEADYQKTLRRMNQDYAIEDARRNNQRARQIASINDNLQQQTEEAVKSYNERLVDIQEDAREQEIQAQKDYQKRRRDLQIELGQQLLQSARRLDALGVINAIQKYNEQNRKENESFNEAAQQRAGQLADRLAQEQESHEERLQAARDAATQQLEDLRTQYAEEDQIRQEDRALRLSRMQEDHNEQLAEMDRTHQERLAQIDNQAAQERNLREQAFVEQINALGGHEGRMLDIQEQGQIEMEAALRRWWNRQTDMIDQTVQQAQDRARQQDNARRGDNYRGYQSGGRIWGTGLYKLHQGEEVIRPSTAATIRRMMGGSIDQDALAGALAGGSGVQIDNVSFVINAQPGQDEEAIADYAIQKLIGYLDQL